MHQYQDHQDVQIDISCIELCSLSLCYPSSPSLGLRERDDRCAVDRLDRGEAYVDHILSTSAIILDSATTMNAAPSVLSG